MLRVTFGYSYLRRQLEIISNLISLFRRKHIGGSGSAEPEEAHGQRRRVIWKDFIPVALVAPLIMYAFWSYHVIIDRFDAQEAAERTSDHRACLSMMQTQSKWLAHELIDLTQNTHYSPSGDPGLADMARIDGVLTSDSSGKPICSRNVSRRLAYQLLCSRHVQAAAAGMRASGIVASDGSLYGVASGPDGHGGAITVIQCIDADLLARISRVPDCGLALFVNGKRVAAVSPNGPVAMPAPSPSEIDPEYVSTSDDTVIRVSQDGLYTRASRRLFDWDGRVVAVLTTTSSRRASLANRNAAGLQAGLFVISGVLLAGFGMLQMRSRIIMRSAMVDELTGLYNHRYLQEFLGQEVARSLRYSRPLAVAMLDIDHFKDINDTYGHLVGDQALKHLARLLESTVRTTDVVARYGGEEFVIIMPETMVAEAVAMAERVRQCVEAAVLDVKPTGKHSADPQQTVKFTISIGVAGCPVHADQGDGLLMAADLGLFAAKRASRNAVVSYDSIAVEASEKHTGPKGIHLSMREGTLSAIKALAAVIDARDHTVKGHSEKVALFSLAIGTAMDLPVEEMNRLRTSALLHDVGRTSIPDSILQKPGRLTAEEHRIVAAHCNVGASILSNAPQLSQEANIVLHHHESFDGSGYPDGLKGEEIPLLSRIIRIADSYDAMTCDRPHRSAASARSVLKAMRQQAGAEFDPAIVEILDELVTSGRIQEILSSFQVELGLAA